MIVHDRFEQETVWGHLVADPLIEHRALMYEEMIPGDAQRILDVGCGDGAITNRLAQRWEVAGVDLSPTALQHVQTTAVQASATRLPFPDKSFDLVLSGEMLEHLSDSDYRQSIAEMRRVTRRYLLLSVPYREDLPLRTIRCPRCGWRGHVWGHKQTFSAESLLADLHGFTAIQTRTFGPPQEPPWPRWLLWGVHNVLRSYYWGPGQSPLCERCGNTEFSATRAIHPALHRLNRWLRGRNRPPMPFFLVVLAENSAG